MLVFLIHYFLGYFTLFPTLTPCLVLQCFKIGFYSSDCFTYVFFKTCFILLSVYPLYITSTATASFSQSSQGGGHRTLLYGHAILLKHTHSSMVSASNLSCPLMQQSRIISLLCLVTVSLVSCCSTWAVWRLPGHWQTSWPLTWACRKTPLVTLHFIAHYLPCMAISASNRWIYMYVTGEACWWTIHPASKQRSEGEKVRVGDDLILVSVSSERYLVTTILFTYILTKLISYSLPGLVS